MQIDLKKEKSILAASTQMQLIHTASLVLTVKMFMVWYYSKVSSASKCFSSDVELAISSLSASVQHVSLSSWICWLSWELSGSFWNILSSLKCSFSWVLSCMAESMGDWDCCDKNFKRTERMSVTQNRSLSIASSYPSITCFRFSGSLGSGKIILHTL